MIELKMLLQFILEDPLSMPFREPVNAMDAPHYYDIIKNPMDIAVIKNKVRNGKYKGTENLMADVELMVQNCEYYNEPDSELVRDAKQLFARSAVRRRELGPKLLDVDLTPKDMPKLLKVIKTLKKDPNADIFAAPVPLDDPDIPGYAEKIARPIDLSEILGRLSAKAEDPYATFTAFVEDVILVWENCRSYNGKDHYLYTIANRLENLFVKEFLNVLGKRVK